MLATRIPTLIQQRSTPQRDDLGSRCRLSPERAAMQQTDKRENATCDFAIQGSLLMVKRKTCA